MKAMTLVHRAFRLSLLACGLLLALAAVAGTAQAGLQPPPPSPEIDPGSIAGALTLLAGGLLILRSRRRSSS